MRPAVLLQQSWRAASASLKQTTGKQLQGRSGGKFAAATQLCQQAPQELHAAEEAALTDWLPCGRKAARRVLAYASKEKLPGACCPEEKPPVCPGPDERQLSTDLKPSSIPGQNGQAGSSHGGIPESCRPLAQLAKPRKARPSAPWQLPLKAAFCGLDYDLDNPQSTHCLPTARTTCRLTSTQSNKGMPLQPCRVMLRRGLMCLITGTPWCTRAKQMRPGITTPSRRPTRIRCGSTIARTACRASPSSPASKQPTDTSMMTLSACSTSQLAMQQAENIIAFHLPEVDFKVILGQCFADFKGQVGAACARAMVMRALSYNAHGRRKLAVLAVSHPQRRDQLLHINEAPIPPVAHVHVA